MGRPRGGLNAFACSGRYVCRVIVDTCSHPTFRSEKRKNPVSIIIRPFVERTNVITAETLDASEKQSDYIVELIGITKSFPGIVANSDVTLRVKRGGFHAVIGENGAGKSTLLNILYGRYLPDSGCGTILIDGQDVTGKLTSPLQSIRAGIGLVSQHYALIPALSVLENVILGSEEVLPGGVLRRKEAAGKIQQIMAQLGLSNIDLNVRAEKLSVAAQQKVEIVKALYRRARVLLLDEPTAVLAPAEATALFGLLQTLRDAGTTIVFVTHKLREVMSYSTDVTVLRGGKCVGSFKTAETTREELLERMIGTRAPQTEILAELENEIKGGVMAATASERRPLLKIQEATVKGPRGTAAVASANLNLFAGEIVGVAGVDGSGQRELSEAVVGLRALSSGSVQLASADFLSDCDITRLTVRARQKLGIAYIPEDRHRAGMILDFTIGENYLLGHEKDASWGGGFALNRGKIADRATTMIGGYDVRLGTRTSDARAGDLSGGNQQKVVIARALDGQPRVLVACQPTRGLDTGASGFVYEALRKAREAGMGVLLFSLDLDEVLALSDRIAVMFNGQIVDVLPRGEATAETVGALMTGAATGGGSR
jgi:general nucleoside transport system ATP-binding protein